ncbi:glucosamine-6-phosphate deaminase [Anaerococcus sp. AGMB00486]|uniref:Glucosamine-6-phosphate deaminase n=2 Tax=Anaerococcus TaxID=165779 RepID=A0ABX2N8R9_9FIRM|nr:MULTISPECIES: glucosamine-6-phosphate deaminase [Anaerococcus]MDY3006583.1 glucosamine-6-phosphate deaminase [Anaerococcus porci]MSS77433.1 glucosamine-6-phosphate deaminase [Anaerococcus porci]NVF11092.1 glucosamine-6-phosphate deaminase [Anaerococcus faecalis]
MKVIVSDSYEEMSKKAADLFKSLLVEKPQSKLGLATGSTPVGLYENLVKAQKDGEISFHWAKSVNLDEYVGIDPKNEQSYQYFMDENLFNKVNIKKENTHLPKADTNDEKYAKEYDKVLDEMGPRDIQILGLGNNGHIAFNEPADKLNKRTSIVKLTDETIKANSRFFKSEEDVPKYAISMGMADAFNAKTIIVLASGKNKFDAVKKIIEDDKIDTNFPASLLHLHPNCYLFVDKEAYEG